MINQIEGGPNSFRPLSPFKQKKNISVIKTTKKRLIAANRLKPKTAPIVGIIKINNHNPDLLISWSLLTYNENQGIKKRNDKNK